MSDRFSISLRLLHPRMRHEEIINKIGLNACVGHTVGEARRSPLGNELGGKYRETMVVIDVVEKDGYFVDEIAQVLSDLERNSDYFVRLVETGGSVTLYVGVFFKGRSGFELNLDCISKMKEMCIDLSVEYYAD